MPGVLEVPGEIKGAKHILQKSVPFGLSVPHCEQFILISPF